MCLFFFNDPPTTEIYPLSQHDALRTSGTHGEKTGIHSENRIWTNMIGKSLTSATAVKPDTRIKPTRRRQVSRRIAQTVFGTCQRLRCVPWNDTSLSSCIISKDLSSIWTTSAVLPSLSISD